MVYLEAAIQGFSFIQSSYFSYTWGITMREVGGIRAASSLSVVSVEVVSFVGFSEVFFLFYYFFCEPAVFEELSLVAAL